MVLSSNIISIISVFYDISFLLFNLESLFWDGALLFFFFISS